MGNLTMWGAREFLTTFFTRGTEPPQGFYLALIRTTPPTQYISGSELDEPEGSYQRVEIPNSSLYWDDTGRMNFMANSDEHHFIQATEDWGQIKYWALCNAPVDGYVYAVGELGSPINVLDGDTVVIGAGELLFEVGTFYGEG